MEGKWLVIKLTRLGETTEREILVASVKEILGQDAIIFIPFKRTKDLKGMTRAQVLEGYIFVTNFQPFIAESFDRSSYFELLNNRVKYVSDPYISKMKQKMREICEEKFTIGEKVIIIDGPFSRLKGVTYSETKKTIKVKIDDDEISSRLVILSLDKHQVQKI